MTLSFCINVDSSVLTARASYLLQKMVHSPLWSQFYSCCSPLSKWAPSWPALVSYQTKIRSYCLPALLLYHQVLLLPCHLNWCSSLRRAAWKVLSLFCVPPCRRKKNTFSFGHFNKNVFNVFPLFFWVLPFHSFLSCQVCWRGPCVAMKIIKVPRKDLRKHQQKKTHRANIHNQCNVKLGCSKTHLKVVDLSGTQFVTGEVLSLTLSHTKRDQKSPANNLLHKLLLSSSGEILKE